MCKLTILDVGHGNCAVLQDEQGLVVIDGGKRQALLQHLRQLNARFVNMVLISHGDSDHIGGVIELLLDRSISIQSVYLNKDSRRSTAAWGALLQALNDRFINEGTEIFATLTTTRTDTSSFNRGGVHLQVLSPTDITVLGGPGEVDVDASSITSNSMSAVIRIVTDAKSEVLLAADMNGATLRNMLSRSVDLQAQVLVFPHHGGLSRDADLQGFARDLCRAVQPELIVFSIGRDGDPNPRPEVVAGVREGAPTAHIACTQLSRHCAANVPNHEPVHLSSFYARGRHVGKCCAGTLEVQLGQSMLTCVPLTSAHLAFVIAEAPTALCQMQIRSSRTPT